MKTLSLNPLKLSLLFIIVSMLAVSCKPDNTQQPVTEAAPSPTHVLATPVKAVNTYTPTPTNTPTNTPVPPTATNTPIPTNTPTLTPTNTITPTPVNVTYQNGILIYFIHPNTGGPVGCGDSLVPLTIGYVKSDDVVNDLTIALNALFSAGHYSGALVNLTYTSNLHVDRIEFNKFSGLARVFLSGSFTKPPTNCEKSSYHAQVWATAKQFPEIKRAEIHVGSLLLGDLLAYSSKEKNKKKGKGGGD